MNYAAPIPLTPKYREFDRSRLSLAPLGERVHDLDLAVVKPLARTGRTVPALETVARRIYEARETGAAVVMMMGAHVLRSGMQRYLIDLMERGFLSCLAMNGAGMIHDYEMALIGATTECVGRYLRDGSFGMWRETGRLNAVAVRAAQEGLGLGQASGRTIYEEPFPHADVSLLAAGYRLRVPVTVHVQLGCDIVHQHPDCDGAAYGAGTYRDFLIYTAVLESLEGGVVMNFGSAVMGPEIFLKALSMVRNAARSEGRRIARFTTLVCDLADLPENVGTEAARDDPRYYFRPWKTLLVRAVKDGGSSHYVSGRHAETIPDLWTYLDRLDRKEPRP
ncbi:MAG: hypothetical protein AB1896_21105 [Thermodesulfobacteriota bacterium]